MRCALDLQATAKLKAEENTKAEILRQQREEMARRIHTIAFCEKLGKELEEKAEKGYDPRISFYCEASRQHRLLIETRREYADHRKSHYPTGEALDLDLIVEWFAQYCFEVDCRKKWTWHYGWGQVNCLFVIISPKAQCLQ